MTEIELRVKAAQATLDRFKSKPLKYGTNDCVRMVAMHLRKLGHRVVLPASGAYTTVKSGLRELKARGFANLAEAMDSFGFERIAPAAAVVGDVLMLPGDSELGSMVIALGNGRVIGYHEDAKGACTLQPVEYAAAWRVRVV
ncbi:MAG: hypothetical protein ABW043_16740 [Devosia sp.]|uniref:DUF6950 family protein n=1 Tax=Devosia sp. TaxID=1871048 RepID=UPI00339B73E3